MKHVKIFWTGGWDSTYMLCALAREAGLTIEPVYIVNHKRKSRFIEIERMREILELVRKHPDTKAVILDITQFSAKDIPKNDQISAARKRIADKTGLGYQYDYLARYAATVPEEIGIGIEDSSHAVGASSSIKTYGEVKKQDGFYHINPAKSSQDINVVFGKFFFPLFDVTEQDMLTNIKKWGYDSIMKRIWFCHSPIKNEPCGICNPCVNKMDDLPSLLPPISKSRYEKFKKIRKRSPRLAKILRNIYLAIFS